MGKEWLIDELLNIITEKIRQNKKKVKLLIPYDKQSLLNALYNEYVVEGTEYGDDGVLCEVILDARGLGLYKKYTID